jgi:predicted ATPase/DNA-binding SARP family transcriptional activator
MNQGIQLYLLGTFQVKLAGEPALPLESDKARALLAYLAMESGYPHRRTSLTELLWPDFAEKAARHNLSQVLFSIRQSLAGDKRPFLLADRHTIQIAPQTPLWLDTVEFETLLAACASHEHQQVETCAACMDVYRQAVTLYRGDFLKGHAIDASTEFDNWMAQQRERLHRLAVETLAALAHYHEWQSELSPALLYIRQQLALEPWREEAHRQLMRLLARQGEYNAALAQYEQCRKHLVRELGVEPDVTTRSLYERIHALRHRPSPHNLPPPAAELIGRAKEVAYLKHLLAHPERRLITLLGPGGVGKTHLAQEVARRQAVTFMDGVFFVPLAGLATSDTVVVAIAAALNLRLSNQASPRDQLLAYLGRRELLLVLDNFEQLVEAATDLVQAIGETAVNTTLLITSRHPLNLQAEWRLSLNGLPYPKPDNPNDDGAAAFFIHSVRKIQAGFTPNAAERAALSHICQLVEGLPLALEMAAAWVPHTSCQVIAQEIERGLAFLTTPMRDVPLRHHSMRAVFEHSWCLLPDEERIVLAQLSVFSASCSREAAQTITGTTADILNRLQEKFLLQPAEQADRIRLHELLRQFAAEKLADDRKQQTTVQQVHSTYYLNWLAKHEKDFLGDKAAGAVTAVQNDLANIRTAWNWAAAQRETALLRCGMHGLAAYYQLAGPLAEGSQAFRRAVVALRGPDYNGQANAREKETLGELIAYQSRLLTLQARYAEAIEAARSLLELAQAIGHTALEAEGRLRWGEALCRQTETVAAQSHLEEALRLGQAVGQQPVAYGALLNLGVVVGDQGDVPQARNYFEQALAISRELGDRRGEETALHNLSVAAIYQNDHATAQSYLERQLQICQASGDRRVEAASLLGLGMIHSHHGDFAGAEQRYQGALQIAQEMNQQREAGSALSHLGLIALYRGLYEEANSFLERAQRINEAIEYRQGLVLGHLHQGIHQRHTGQLEEARKTLQEALEMACQIGERRAEATSLCQLSLACGQLGNEEAAVMYGYEAHNLTQQLGDHALQGKALCSYAHALAAQGKQCEAATAYQAALTLHCQMGQPHLANEALAGLAHLAIESGKVDQAQKYVIQILTYLETGTTDGMELAERVHRICQHVSL